MSKLKEIVLADASTEAKVAALAVLVDKKLLELAEVVMSTKKLEGPKGEQGLQGPKGEQGDHGLQGDKGLDGKDGVDGKDGKDGVDGVSVVDARIDFDGTLVITLSNGKEITAGDVVPEGVAKDVNIITSGNGTAKVVTDTLASLQAQIDAITGLDGELGTMAQQDDTAVDINGGAIDGTIVGAVTPAAGTFTTLSTGTLSTGTLTATGQTSLGGAAGSESVRVTVRASATDYINLSGGSAATGGGYIGMVGAQSANSLYVSASSTGGVRFYTNSWQQEQMRVSHTASAVNYVQVTGAATGNKVRVSSAGSDASVGMTFDSKGSGSFAFTTNANANPNFSIFPQDSPINYLQVRGASTGIAAQMSSLGSDTNVAMALVSKGTGAIDLAAGSRGVNISNGGTVTAITRTNQGANNYTSVPTCTISAPTTAGGVQATATVSVFNVSATVGSGGTGYSLNDVLTVTGGTTAEPAMQFTVTGVSGGVVTTISATRFASYSVTPSNPASVTGGTGTGATLNILYALSNTGITFTNAGSGYVEQPTVTFSGGGGSGAAAYATVGSGTTVKTLGSTMSFSTAGGEQFRVSDNAGATQYITAVGSSTGNVAFNFSGSGTGGFSYVANSGSHRFWSSGSAEQLRVAHTASAVNYVQVTGAATGAGPIISVQGSDANAEMRYRTKGVYNHSFQNGNGNANFIIDQTAGNSVVNRLQVAGSVAGSAPSMSSVGSDTNIDLTLTPKGTGNVKFGTLTASADAPITGYITIKDSGGTVRKLAVIA